MKFRLFRPIWIATFVILGMISFAHAQKSVATPSLVTTEVNEQLRTTLHGSVASQLKTATDLGAMPANRKLNRMVMVLKPTDAQQKDLRSLIQEQQTRGSAQYHKWLTPAEFSTRFSPSADDVAKVAGWLQSRGFTNVTPSVSGQRIEFSGTASTVETAFQTPMHLYQVKTTAGVEAHVANSREISIPSALSPVVSGVLSLNDFRAKPMHVDFGKAQRNSDGKLVRVKGDASFTDGNGNFQYNLAPGDIRKIYGASSLPASVDGTGVSVAIIGRSNVQLTDIQAFHKIFKLPAKDQRH
jgi:subtilase family serine protease